jgi:hypothetical protein
MPVVQGETFGVEAWTRMSMRLWPLRVANENAILPLPGKIFARIFLFPGEFSKMTEIVAGHGI